jgi:hypothetical protein
MAGHHSYHETIPLSITPNILVIFYKKNKCSSVINVGVQYTKSLQYKCFCFSAFLSRGLSENYSVLFDTCFLFCGYDSMF